VTLRTTSGGDEHPPVGHDHHVVSAGRRRAAGAGEYTEICGTRPDARTIAANTCPTASRLPPSASRRPRSATARSPGNAAAPPRRSPPRCGAPVRPMARPSGRIGAVRDHLGACTRPAHQHPLPSWDASPPRSPRRTGQPSAPQDPGSVVPPSRLVGTVSAGGCRPLHLRLLRESQVSGRSGTAALDRGEGERDVVPPNPNESFSAAVSSTFRASRPPRRARRRVEVLQVGGRRNEPVRWTAGRRCPPPRRPREQVPRLPFGAVRIGWSRSLAHRHASRRPDRVDVGGS